MLIETIRGNRVIFLRTIGADQNYNSLFSLHLYKSERALDETA